MGAELDADLPEAVLEKAEFLADFLAERRSLVLRLMAHRLESFLVTLGAGGVLLMHREHPDAPVELHSAPCPQVQRFVSASGAGDW